MKDGAPAGGEPPGPPGDAPPDLWADAAQAADLLALDPAGLGGARLRARPGPARELWLARLRAGLPEGAPFRRLPAHATEERLLGGLDLAETLAAGRPVARAGLLAEAHGGVVALAMAERAAPAVAAHLSTALDRGEIRVERDGIAGAAPARIAVVALDEGAGAEEAAPAALVERLAFDLALDRARPPPGADRPDPGLAAARARLPRVVVDAALVAALCEAAEALGVASPRAPLFALRAARAAAALAGRETATEADAALAARLVLGPRATRLPPAEAEDAAPPDAPDPEPPAPDDDGGRDAEDRDEGDDAASDPDLTEILLAAAKAALPAGLLASLRGADPGRAKGGAAGAAGAMRRAATRGRPIGARPGRPEGGARLDVVETLRAAAPWQPMRRRETGLSGVLIRREDFRIRRFKRPAETLTVFAVDASGSAAAQRLAEAKGAVELLLAESYVRRDRVALVAFRGLRAELLLPPTRSLVRAKRGLAGLPGGGGTPLAAGLELATLEAEAARRRGWTPTVVLLTDGKANVARAGAGREAAEAEALAAAARLRALGVAALLIDTSPRPNPKAAALAAAMGARLLALPRADGARLSAAVRAVRDG